MAQVTTQQQTQQQNQAQQQVNPRDARAILYAIEQYARLPEGSPGPDKVSLEFLNSEEGKKLISFLTTSKDPLQTSTKYLELFRGMSKEDKAEIAKKVIAINNASKKINKETSQKPKAKPQEQPNTQQTQQPEAQQKLKENLSFKAIEVIGGGDLVTGLTRISGGGLIATMAMAIVNIVNNDYQSVIPLANAVQKAMRLTNAADLTDVLEIGREAAYDFGQNVFGAAKRRDNVQESIKFSSFRQQQLITENWRKFVVNEVFHYDGKTFNTKQEVEEYKMEKEEQVSTPTLADVEAKEESELDTIRKARQIISSANKQLDNLLSRFELPPLQTTSKTPLVPFQMGSHLDESIYDDAVLDDGTLVCAGCLQELLESQRTIIQEAKYQGRTVTLNKPMKGDVKKSKVYVRDPKTGNVKKVNFGDKNMKIKKNIPGRRKSFRARHNCDNPGPKTKARYWSCRAW